MLQKLSEACLFLLAISPTILWGQAPVIFVGGVVNSASYTTAPDDYPLYTNGIGYGVAGGSIVSIFGTNLAGAAQIAQTLPLPTKLAGTAVKVNGVAAPLFYVSPGLINFQMPSSIPSSGIPTIVVSTPAGNSDPYAIDYVDAFGVFTVDSSGCGAGLVLNVKPDGSYSLNSPSNSASPGDYLVIYGTGLGLVYNSPPDGWPTPLSPLTRASQGTGPVFDFAGLPPAYSVYSYWAGLAPGLVGVNQINFLLPDTIREGCAVPMQIESYAGFSPPVTIAIRNGGGPCADPPSASYGQITWEKSVTTTPNPTGGGSTAAGTETLTVSLQASPGKQTPNVVSQRVRFFGPACPIPGYVSLDAGNVTIQGPGYGLTQVPNVSLQSGPVRNLSVYQAVLPSGTMRPGSFVVNASGGADVGAFQSTVQIGSPIQITTPLAGIDLVDYKPLRVNWTGGDQNSLVTIYLISHSGSSEQILSYEGPASGGSITLTPNGQIHAPNGQPPVPTFDIQRGPDMEIVVEVTPDPTQATALAAQGLSLGGEHTWKYSYHFKGIVLSQ